MKILEFLEIKKIYKIIVDKKIDEGYFGYRNQELTIVEIYNYGSGLTHFAQWIEDNKNIENCLTGGSLYLGKDFYNAIKAIEAIP